MLSQTFSVGNIHIHALLSLAFSGAPPLQEHTSSCVMKLWPTMTDPHIHTNIWCLHRHTYTLWRVSLSHLKEHFPYTHAGVTLILCTYYVLIFLLEMVVSQTLLWDIWAWSVCFLFYLAIPYFVKRNSYIKWYKILKWHIMAHSYSPLSLFKRHWMES